MKSSQYILVCILVLPFFSSAQFYNTEVEAKINLEKQNENLLQIVGRAHNKTEVNKSLRYELSVIKSNANSKNKSNNAQEGRFVLEPQAQKNLSSTTINMEGGQRTIILLLVYDEEDKLVGKDRRILNGFEGEDDAVFDREDSSVEKDIKDTNEDGFILKGLVVEDTKTKAGNDFYDFFYSSYLVNNINGEKVVKIEEKLALGNNTQIYVVVGEDVVAQFYLNPRSQFLKTMADQCVNRVNSYFQRSRTNKEQIKRY